jgi:hypothetical protein
MRFCVTGEPDPGDIYPLDMADFGRFFLIAYENTWFAWFVVKILAHALAPEICEKTPPPRLTKPADRCIIKARFGVAG